MFLIYTPEGQEEQRWLYQPGRLKTNEMIAIERRTGLKYGGQFKQDLMQGGTLARKALLWTFLRRTHHTISFDDVDFYDDELQLVMDRDELTAEIEALESFDGITEDERRAGLALLRQQLAEAPYAPGKDPGTPPTPPTPAGPEVAAAPAPQGLGNYGPGQPRPWNAEPAMPHPDGADQRLRPVMAELEPPADADGPSTTSATSEPPLTWPTPQTSERGPGPELSRH
ncbi:hypothetical protein [Actinoplanes sp. NPDC049316]|uniref:hypothetical protein n=1 Tax=Actinoplanes sp. NPDC049316 TaxID=3154727 RepID=UPI0034482BA5